MPKDQLALLKRCLHNEIPAIVLSAKDICSIPALQAYMAEAKKHCDQEFLDDLEQVIECFVRFSKEESEKMEVPDL